jgi:hypothetical protein
MLINKSNIVWYVGMLRLWDKNRKNMKKDKKDKNELLHFDSSWHRYLIILSFMLIKSNNSKKSK